MSLALRLVGNLTDGSVVEGWLTRAQEWLHESWAHALVASEIRAEHRSLALAFQLHPAAPDLLIGALDPQAAGPLRQLRLEAPTRGVGPGYHAHVCELVRALEEELGVRWSAPGDGPADTSGFFDSGDLAALEAAALADLTEEVGKLAQRPRLAGSTLWLPNLHRFEVGEALATPLGPRDRGWLERVLVDASAGRDVFAWWEVGMGPGVLLGRALAEMWTNIRWRRAATETEASQVQSILELLKQVEAANPNLPLPRSEWAELESFLSERPSSAPAVERAPSPSAAIGYRRRDVRVRVGCGWSVRIPGSFAEEWDEPDTFTAWGEGKTLRVTTMADAESPIDEFVTGSQPVELRLPTAYEQAASLGEAVDVEDPLLTLRAALRMQGQLAAITITLDSKDDELWALRTVEAFEHEALGAALGGNR
jgi:hypothetical protein